MVAQHVDSAFRRSQLGRLRRVRQRSHFARLLFLKAPLAQGVLRPPCKVFWFVFPPLVFPPFCDESEASGTTMRGMLKGNWQGIFHIFQMHMAVCAPPAAQINARECILR